MNSYVAGCAFLLVATSIIGASAQETNAAAVDVLGVKLGMQPENAIRLASGTGKKLTVQLYRDALSRGPFTSKPMTFGATVSGQGNQGIERIAMVFSTVPGIGLDYVSRVVDYSQAPSKITVATARQSLIQKYGPPTYTDNMMPSSSTLFWRYGPTAMGPTKKLNMFSRDAACPIRLQEGQAGKSMMGHPEDEADTLKMTAKCGAWMSVRIDYDGTNNQLVGGVTFILTDFTKLDGSGHYLEKLMADGSMAAARAQTAHAAGAKPQL